MNTRIKAFSYSLRNLVSHTMCRMIQVIGRFVNISMKGFLKSFTREALSYAGLGKVGHLYPGLYLRDPGRLRLLLSFRVKLIETGGFEHLLYLTGFFHHIAYGRFVGVSHISHSLSISCSRGIHILIAVLRTSLIVVPFFKRCADPGSLR